MKLVKHFIRNRIVIYALSTIIILIGFNCYLKLPVTALPPIVPQSLLISTTYQNASPQFMEQEVTTPIEKAIDNINGIDTVRSVSSLGISHIHVNFKYGANINQVKQDIKNKLSLVRNKLPKNVNEPVAKLEDGQDANAIMYIGLYSDKHNESWLSSYYSHGVENALKQIFGVGKVDTLGLQEQAININLNLQKMAEFQITFEQVKEALENMNVSVKGGTIHNKDQSYVVVINAKPSSIEAFKNIVIKHFKNGDNVYLKDIATAELGSSTITQITRINGYPGVIAVVYPSRDANIIEVANKVKKLVHQQQGIFQSGNIKILLNLADYVKHLAHEVNRTLVETLLLVALVILLFLGSIRLSIVTLCVIPISILVTFGYMYYVDYSINLITLLAIILSIGLIVDDAIVVLENIKRNFKNDCYEAVVTGTSEIFYPVIAMTLTLAIVYLPVAFLTGAIGDIIRPFVYTLAFAVIVSGICSLTITPSMCSQLLDKKHLHNKYIVNFELAIDRLVALYSYFLRKCINHKLLVIFFMAILFLIGIFLLINLKSEMIPQENYGLLVSDMSVPENSSLAYQERKMEIVSSVYKNISGNNSYFTYLNSSTGESNAMLILSHYKNTDSIKDYLNNELSSSQGFKVFTFQTSAVSAGFGSELPIQFVLTSNSSYQELANISNKIMDVLNQENIFRGIKSDLDLSNQEYSVSTNNPLINDLGISAQSIAESISALYGGYQLENNYDSSGSSCPIIVSIPKDQQGDFSPLNNMFVLNNAGKYLGPIANFVQIENYSSPSDLSHFDGMRSVTIKSGLANNISMQSSMKKVESMLHKELPRDVEFYWTGPAKQYLDSSHSMSFILISALIFIYLMLTIQFKSFTDPLIILFTIPLSFVGAVIFLKISGGTLNIYTKLGFLTLVGLIAKHGILMVHYANRLRQTGASVNESIVLAAGKRFRPIVMTTFAMMLGTVPLTFLNSPGSHALNQIGVAIVGGISLGTVFSLIFVPVIYSLLSKLRSF